MNETILERDGEKYTKEVQKKHRGRALPHTAINDLEIKYVPT